jgi:hypothetical protein
MSVCPASVSRRLQQSSLGTIMIFAYQLCANSNVITVALSCRKNWNFLLQHDTPMARAHAHATLSSSGQPQCVMVGATWFYFVKTQGTAKIFFGVYHKYIPRIGISKYIQAHTHTWICLFVDEQMCICAPCSQPLARAYQNKHKHPFQRSRDDSDELVHQW